MNIKHFSCRIIFLCLPVSTHTYYIPRIRLLIPIILAIILTGCTSSLPDINLTRKTNLEKDHQFLKERAVQLDRPLTLDKAIQLSLELNLDAKVLVMEHDIRQEILTAAKLKMLPELSVNAEVSRRNREDAVSSQSIITGNESLEPSFSTEKTVNRQDFSLLWNILDFGISFYQSRQEESRVEVALQRLRRIRQNLILDVTEAYWQAMIAKETAATASELIKRIKKRLDIIGKQIESQMVSEVEGLELAVSLIEMEFRMEGFEQKLQKNKIQLATLMGLPQDTDFELAEMENEELESLQFDIETLEEEALLNRPELFEQDLEERITADEAKIKLIEMFPSPSLFWRYNRDENKFLFYDSWYTFGLKAACNLLSIPHKAKLRDAAIKRKNMIRMRRIAIGIGILTQLHLSVIEYQDALRRYQLLKKLTKHRNDLKDALHRQISAGKAHDALLLDSESRALFAKDRLLRALADVKTALQRIWNANGRNYQVNMAQWGNGMSDGGGEEGHQEKLITAEKQISPKTIQNTEENPTCEIKADTKNEELDRISGDEIQVHSKTQETEKSFSTDEKREATLEERTLKRGDEKYFIVNKGNSLASISGRKDVYGNPLKWPILFRINQDKFKGIPILKNFPQKPIQENLALIKVVSSEMAERKTEEMNEKAWVANVMSCLSAEELTLPAIRLSREGYKVYIVPTKLKGKQWYRLRIGFYSSYKEAKKASEKIKTMLELNDAWVINIDKDELTEFAVF